MQRLDRGLQAGLLALAVALPVSIALSSILFFPLVIIWAVAAWRTGLWRPTFGPVETAFVIFLGITLISTLSGIAPLNSLRKMEKDLYFFMYLMTFGLITTENQRRLLLKAFLWATLAVSLLGLLQFAIGVNQSEPHDGFFIHLPAALAHWPRPLLDFLSMINGRVAATRSHPLTFAECLLFGWSLTVAALLWVPQRFLRRGLWAVAVIGAALLLSQSRGPWLAALAIVIVAMVLYYSYAGRPQVWHGMLLLPVVLVLTVPSLRQRARSIGDTHYFSNEERFEMWRAGAALVKAHPLLGIGPGNVRFVAPQFEDPERVRQWGPWGHLHNVYVNTAAERGLLGLAAFLGLMGMLGWQLWVAVRSTSGLTQALCAAGLLSWLGFLISGVTEVVYNDTTVLMNFYFVMGAALARPPRAHAQR